MTKLHILLIFTALFFLVTTAVTGGPGTDTPVKKASALTALGQQLFFEKRLSFNGIKSCGSCHAPEFAFTDGYRRSLGAGADLLQRNTPSVLNLSSYKTFNLADPEMKDIEQQLLHPLFNSDPPELGMLYKNDRILRQLEQDAAYSKILSAAGIEHLSWGEVIIALAVYIRSLEARNALYDQYLSGRKTLTDDELQGKQLFFSAALNCAACHSGTDFNQPRDTAAGYFFNTGLYNIGNRHTYADNDNGIANSTHNDCDMGKFRVPSLRNVAVTAPYFHDGSAATLEDVIDVYSNGGRNITDGPYKGTGSLNPYKSDLIRSFSLTPKEKKQLILFLYTLTDTAYLQNPLFQNPLLLNNLQQ